MYEYKCKVNRVIDGDSLDCSIDLGFGIMFNSKVRLYGIDTPESRTRDEDEKIRGLLAKEYLINKITSAKQLVIQTEKDAKDISFKIANSLLVKTAIAGEDPNWGRVAMAIGNSNIKINEQKLSISFGPYKIYQKGSLCKSYDEEKVMEYMKGKSIEIEVDIGQGIKKFKSYTMDLTKKYIEINADYRT